MKRLSNILRQEGLRTSASSKIAVPTARSPKSKKLLGKALEALTAAHDALHDDVYSELAPASDLKKLKELVSALERLAKV